ncbi:aspartate aminotransferase family protein [Nocardia rhizosphaerihabitans]|uniref:Aspartate aminotransferase family protein n=2 Tax=Nocardia rhizosphaerihabitans TaxID=1691570 RepID=A0ABQ2KD72_9NOCA|nr:aspartate aminotransferase family protein [Nocardia rhizosphaerihabitans]
MQVVQSTQPFVGNLVNPMSLLKGVAAGGPLVIASATGSTLTTADGRQLLDGMAGLINVNVGYGRSELAHVAAASMEELAFGTLFFGRATPPALALAGDLAALAPGEINQFFFTNSGSEANDSAYKFARLFHWLRGEPDRVKIIGRERNYHGMTMGGTAATWDKEFHVGIGPLQPGFLHVPQPTADWQADLAILGARILAEGPETIAAFVAEPISMPAGSPMPAPEYWPEVRRLLDRHGILWIADEVVTGFGRTGRMFAVEHWGADPDMLLMSKGVTSGYLPLGAVGLSDRIHEVFRESDRPMLHGFTTGGHPVSCAVARENLRIIHDENLVERSRKLGEYFRAGLERLSATREVYGAVRSLGLIVSIDLNPPEAFAAAGGTDFPALIPGEALGRGGVLRAYDGCVSFAPPLVITESEIDQLISTLDASVAAVLDRVGR